MAFLADRIFRVKPSATIAVTDKARALKAAGPAIEPIVCVSAQHREMLRDGGDRDVEAFGQFYTSAFGAVEMGQNRYRIGETIFGVYHEPGIHPPKMAPFANPLEVVSAMAELGIQYVTLQVRDCDAAFRALKAAGAAVAVEPSTFGTVARISFVRDPDGNFIELSQRPPA